MGMSIDAKLYYGFPLPDSDYGDNPNYVEDEFEDDFETVYLRSVGIEPFEHLHEGADSTTMSYEVFAAECEETGCRVLRDAWYSKQREAMKASGVEIGRGGHWDSEMTQYLQIEGVGFSSYWGESTVIPPVLPVEPEWAEKLKDFCDKTGLKYQEPKWYLTCRAG